MKNIISIFSIALLSSFILTAQSNETKRADKHFNKFEFIDAAADYEKLVEACEMASDPMKGIDAKTLDVRYEER